jgi:hypothetical protein
MSYQLKNWAVVQSPNMDPYMPPEAYGIYLSGEIYGRGGRFTDGKRVTTSRVVSVDGRLITTQSGSVYELVGDPEPGYLSYLKETGKEYNKENPIKVINKKTDIDWN